MLEDVTELAGEFIDLGFGQLETSKSRHMDHLVASDAFGHALKDTGPFGCCTVRYLSRCSRTLEAMRYPFLSPEWIAAMRELRADYADHEAEAANATADAALQLAANVTVTDPPFADEAILGHIDTTGPALLIEEGHLDNPDFGIEVPWALAKQLFIDRDPTQVMPALFGGAIKLTGDSSKILALASILAPPSGGDPGDNTAPDVVRELIERVDAITEP